MKMIDVLKNELKSDMSIGTEKELSSKWKVTILYNGMQMGSWCSCLFCNSCGLIAAVLASRQRSRPLRLALSIFLLCCSPRGLSGVTGLRPSRRDALLYGVCRICRA